MSDAAKLVPMLESLLLAVNEPLSFEQIEECFLKFDPNIASADIKNAVSLFAQINDRCYRLKQVASGYCLQTNAEFAPLIATYWQEKPARYSRSFLETLAIIAYRQPVTRAEIEDIRGVAVNSNVIKTLLEREWIKIIGHRDVPGKPAILGTSKAFLDYFNLQSLEELPPLSALKDLDSIASAMQRQLDLQPGVSSEDNEFSAEEETVSQEESQPEKSVELELEPS